MQLTQNQFSVAGHWAGKFDESGLQAWAEDLRQQLEPQRVSFGLVFMTPEYFPHAAQVLELLRVHARIPLLAGCSSNSLIAGDQEFEDSPGISLGLYSLPGGIFEGFHFTEKEVEDFTRRGYWHSKTRLSPNQVNGWLVFADPFHLDAETWLQGWNQSYAPLPVVGGLASGDYPNEVTQVYLNGEVYQEGGIAIALRGDIDLVNVLSQGCTPIGETWTITKAERNVIQEIGNRPAYEVLAETYSQLTPDEQKQARGNLFIGLVTNEYLEDFHRGDFLVRNLIGADPKSGAIAVGAFPRPGQTIQFQRRDAATGTEDIRVLLKQAHDQIGDRIVYGACLCSCNGRGHRLFGEPNHDARHVQSEFGPVGLAGFFCNGEIGLVGQKNFLHGYTASVGLFVKKARVLPPAAPE